MRKSVFRRIFFLYAFVLLLAVLFSEVYITNAIKTNQLDNIGNNLSARIDILSDYISFDRTNIDSLCKELKKKAKARITVIDPDGRVIGDSDKESFHMDNHADRPEIKQALDLETGTSIRHSETVKDDFFYRAKKIVRQDTPIGFIRLAVPLKEVNDAINTLRFKIVLIVSLILLTTAIITIWKTEQLRKLLRQVTDFSRSLAKGEIGKKLFLDGGEEFSGIAENLNVMSEKLSETIAQINEEKNRLNVILKSIPDALLIIDSKGTIVISSFASGEFFGDVTLAGRNFFEVVRNQDFSDLMDSVRKNLSSDMKEIKIDYPQEMHLTVSISPLFYRGDELSGFVAVFHDITMLKKLEQVRKDFVANVSHELKTPITAIKGFADTLLEGALDDRENALKFLQIIKSNSERINSLVNDLLTISKIELGAVKIEKTLLHIEDCIENVFALLKSKAEEKGLFLRVSIDPHITEIVADKDKIAQILTNLVDNAIKFTEKGGVTFGTREENGAKIIFVEDTGIGIPEKHLSRLGERFYRVDPARSRKMGGTGLGLAIVKHLVRAHGWELQIQSTQGRGTKVAIRL